MPVTATIDVPPGQRDAASFRVILRITNQTDRTIAVLNPDMGIPSPSMNWPWSNEIYQISLLMSFGYLSISVSDEMGREIPQQAIQTWATPALLPKLEVASGESFELTIPIGDFYQLESGKKYRVALEYGDQDLKVSTKTSVTVP